MIPQGMHTTGLLEAVATNEHQRLSMALGAAGRRVEPKSLSLTRETNPPNLTPRNADRHRYSAQHAYANTSASFALETDWSQFMRFSSHQKTDACINPADVMPPPPPPVDPNVIDEDHDVVMLSSISQTEGRTSTIKKPHSSGPTKRASPTKTKKATSSRATAASPTKRSPRKRATESSRVSSLHKARVVQKSIPAPVFKCEYHSCNFAASSAQEIQHHYDHYQHTQRQTRGEVS